VHVLIYYQHAFRPGGFPGEAQALADALSVRGRGEVKVTLLSGRQLKVLCNAKYLRSVDVLLLIDNGSPTSPWVARRAAKARIPIVLAPGDLFSPFRLQGLAGIKRIIWHRFMFHSMSKKCAAVRVYSSQHADDLRPWLASVELPIVSITEGVDLRLLPPTGWRRPAVVAGRFGFLGRLAPAAKGLDVLLKAWELSGAGALGAELHLRGHQTRDFRVLLQQQWPDGLPTGVVLGGPLDSQDKWDYLASLSVFVHPSRHEGVPRVLREAVTCGRPVLVTPQTNFADLVNEAHCGVVTPLDVSSLAESLHHLAAAPDQLHEMSQRVQLLNAVLDWHRIAGQYLELFDRVLAKT
jgi:glycosyltransferase involved in cell wall biosynthesis